MTCCVEGRGPRRRAAIVSTSRRSSTCRSGGRASPRCWADADRLAAESDASKTPKTIIARMSALPPLLRDQTRGVALPARRVARRQRLSAVSSRGALFAHVVDHELADLHRIEID